jgi:hypothetical protein
MSLAHWRALAALLAITALLLPTTKARADGDPASDYLLTQKAFVPYDAKISATLSEQLVALANETSSKGYPIRIALIASPYDLGAVTALWAKPQQYARFLAAEVAFVYRGRLLIVMPNGFGTYQLGQQSKTEERVLARLKVERGNDGLARSAIIGIQKLAAARGLALSPLRVASPAKRNNQDRLTIGIALAAALAALAAGYVLIPGLRRRLRVRRIGP